MVIAIFPFLIMLAGLLTWVFASNSKLAEAGKIAFFCGLFVITHSLANTSVKLGSYRQHQRQQVETVVHGVRAALADDAHHVARRRIYRQTAYA